MDILQLIQSNEFWAGAAAISQAAVIGTGSFFVRQYGNKQEKNKKSLEGIQIELTAIKDSNEILKQDNKRINVSYDNIEELLNNTNKYYASKIVGLESQIKLLMETNILQERQIVLLTEKNAALEAEVKMLHGN